MVDTVDSKSIAQSVEVQILSRAVYFQYLKILFYASELTASFYLLQKHNRNWGS